MVSGRRSLARLSAVLVFVVCGSLMLPRAQAGLPNPYHPVSRCATVALVGTGAQFVSVTVGGTTKTATVAEAANAKAVVCARVSAAAAVALNVNAAVVLDSYGKPVGLDIRAHATAAVALSLQAELDLRIYANAVVVADAAPADLVLHLVAADVVSAKALVPALVGRAAIVAAASV